MTLEELGWNSSLDESYERYERTPFVAGRIALEHKNLYRIYSPDGERWGEVSGKMRHEARSRSDFPAVGDWVVMERGSDEKARVIIHGVLPRKSRFSRKVAGERSEEQIVAANVDTIFLLTGLDANFNLRRIERYLILAWESGADPVIVLNKADLCDDIEGSIELVQSVALGVPVVAISASEHSGIDQLTAYLRTGRTIALIGSSGVGKSTLTNSLAGGERQRVQEVSSIVGKGKHTTTHREMILLDTGGLIIDTPGMREIGLLGGNEGIAETFDDIESIAAACRFGDCGHHGEPGCAIQEAIDDGRLDLHRFESYRKLQRELAYQERRGDRNAAHQEKLRWKQLTKQQRADTKSRSKR